MNMMAEQMVYKSNALISAAAFRLNAFEQRILLSCIAQVRRDEEVTDEVLYRVTAADLADLAGTDVNNVYKELKAAALKLKRREVWIKEEPNGGKRKPKTLVAGWVQSIYFVDGEGAVELRFNRDVLPYISQLKSHFTGYKLKEVGRMDSAHAIRIYELLAQRKDLGQRDIEVSELKELMQLEDKYKRTIDLKRWVIDPAVKQINDHTSLKVTYTERKSGRKITAFVFMFKEKALPKSRSTQVIEHTPAQAQAQPQPQAQAQAQAQAQPASTDIKAGSIAARVAAMAAEKPKKVLKNQKEMDKLAREGESYAQLMDRLKQQGYKWTFKPVYS